MEVGNMGDLLFWEFKPKDGIWRSKFWIFWELINFEKQGGR